MLYHFCVCHKWSWKHSEKEKGQTCSEPFLGSEQCGLVKGTADVCGKGTAVTWVTLKTIYNLEPGQGLVGVALVYSWFIHECKFIPQPGG